MKQLAAFSLALLISTVSFAQQNTPSKPKLFQNYSDVITCSETELARVFNFNEGQNVSMALANNFSFSGTVTSNLVKYSNLQSVIVKSPAFSNAIFQVSKRTNDDNSITYIGRIINQNYFDGYELKQDAAGNYQLIKIETDKVIQPCH